MKKLISMLLVLCLLLVPMTGNASADDHEQLPVTVAEGQAAPASEPVEFEPGSVPAAAAPMDAISLPIHALVLSMAEQDLLYDAQSDLFVWNALYYTLSLYGSLDDRAERTDNMLILPSETVQDYLSALFAARWELPAIPESLSDRVSYDAASDHYLLIPGHFGRNNIRLDDSAYSDDGSCALNGTLFSLETNASLCAFQVTLIENENMFGFSILNLTIV